MKRDSKTRRRWPLILGGILVAVLFAEGGVRLLGLRPAFPFLGPGLDRKDVFVEDPEVFWRLSPQTPHFVANELGLRGWLPRGAKRRADLRIACVGDSCTFGFGVRYEESYGVVLERLLRERHPHRRVESILAGLPCYSTLQNVVQYEREIAPLRPDVTVLYCGAWNDFTPAVGMTDAERLARNRARSRNPLWWLRLTQIGARVFAPAAPATTDGQRELAEKLPYGYRVSKSEYAANLRSLIEAARKHGSVVVVVLAPHPAKTERERPIALEYRASTRQVANETQALVLDAPALLRDSSPPGETDPYGAWFDDWVHPSIAGHRAIAKGLADLLASHVAPIEVESPSLAVTATQPAEVELFATDALEVSLSAPGAASFERAWWAGYWLRDVAFDGGGRRLRVGLAGLLEPGIAPIELITTAGPIRSQPIAVRPPRLEVTATRVASGVELAIEGHGPAGWYAGVWWSGERREPAAATAWGPFALAGGGGDPFAFERLTLRRAAGKIGLDGTFALRASLSTEELAVLPASLHVQGLLIREDDRRRGAVTQVTTVELPR